VQPLLQRNRSRRAGQEVVEAKLHRVHCKIVPSKSKVVCCCEDAVYRTECKAPLVVAEVEVQIFNLQGPVRIQHPLYAAANCPTSLRVVVVVVVVKGGECASAIHQNSANLEVWIEKRKTTFGVDHCTAAADATAVSIAAEAESA